MTALLPCFRINTNIKNHPVQVKLRVGMCPWSLTLNLASFLDVATPFFIYPTDGMEWLLWSHRYIISYAPLLSNLYFIMSQINTRILARRNLCSLLANCKGNKARQVWYEVRLCLFFFLALWPEKVPEYWKIISSSVYMVWLARQREAVPNMRSSGPLKQALASRRRSLHCQGKYTCI